MGLTATRSIVLGSREFVWAVVTETNGLDLTTSVIQLAVTGHDELPELAEWYTPDVLERPRLSQVRAALLFDAAQTGKFMLWAKIQDQSERIILFCGKFNVVDVR